eukprot:TRINITY_DN5504_c0_g1_i1.p1 TRINITY_DN5504_c0_g1~~TRINITY_DN5504_c0_g1_i1.p1  ORF type:complete len:188 (-),score=1.94 TRINITY_DN5504_c0_g1_i1:42-605(-)
MILQKPDLIALAVGCSAFSHVTWLYDVVWWLFTDRFIIGRASYLGDVELDETWVYTLHQLWFLPLSLLVLYKDYWRPNSTGFKLLTTWKLSTILQTIFTIFAYLFYHDGTHIIDFNTGHELWNSTSASVVHKYDRDFLLIFLMWRIFVQSFILTGPILLILKSFTVLLVEPLPENIKIEDPHKEHKT